MTLQEAIRLDENDPLKKFRQLFHFPEGAKGHEPIYFVGNSLGLEPKKTKVYIEDELTAWAKMAVGGHFKSKNGWYSYHETVTDQMAKVVGALPSEVVCMNTLTVNLHLMMVSFYRPTSKRHKIIIEGGAFSSDRYAVVSQIAFHGFDPRDSLIELKPREGEEVLRHEDILNAIKREGEGLALVLLGNVNFRTGQAFDMEAISRAAQSVGAAVGFDLAHGAGNLLLNLHDWGVDFAVWCSYKYLNSGPGGLSGVFVHESHGENQNLPRFAGWWGHDKKKRFEMAPEFSPMKGAEGWQLSNPPIFPLAALRASLEIFDEAGMKNLVEKSRALTSFFETLLVENLGTKIKIITPQNKTERGCHLSIKVDKAKEIVEKLGLLDVHCDFRPPGVIRAAPVPLYNSFADVFRFVDTFKSVLRSM